MENTEKPKCKLIGEDGNIFNLMGLASIALKKAGQGNKVDEMMNKIMDGCKSYDEALCVLMDYVDVY